MKLDKLMLAAVLCATGAQAAVFEVGPGKPYLTIGAVPWSALNPGDTVLIHWRAAAYAEKWSIGRAGTAAAPITVRGVPSSTGVIPIIDGYNAVTPKGQTFINPDRGVLKIGATYQTPGITPQYIVIEGLEIRRGRSGYSFKNGSGVTDTYISNVAAIYVETGSHITIRDCIFRNNSNGLFIAAGVGAASGMPNRDFLIESNYFVGNGNPGRPTEHHSYTSAAGITFQYNRYGLLYATSDGNALKDRSAGTVIRYNWIEDGNRQLDLVDAGAIASSIASDPRYRETFVYGNTLIERDSTGNRQIVHYGGDSSNPLFYRKGTLHFYNNTVVSKRTGYTSLFRLSTADERCDARNNIFYVTGPGANLMIADTDGRVELHRNWMKAGWRKGDAYFKGTVIDDGSTITSESPGFYNEAAEDYRLAAISLNVNAATLLNPLVLPDKVVLLQYKKHYGAEPRVLGGLLDVGAFEKR